MLKKFFKKEHNNVTFLQELIHKEPDFDWLKEGLKSELMI